MAYKENTAGSSQVDELQDALMRADLCHQMHKEYISGRLQLIDASAAVLQITQT